MNRTGFFRKCKAVINNPWKVFQKINYYKVSHILPDDVFLKLLFRARMGYKLNLNKPMTFSEKLQWLKLYDRKPRYTSLVDKFEVRQYIEHTIGSQHLIPLLGVWESFDEINFDELPNEFVLKCTHDSGSVIICEDKTQFDYLNAKNILGEALKKNFFYVGREWPYKNVKPRIIAEQLMRNIDASELIDYKFMCFNGNVKCCFTCTNRYSEERMKVTYYDAEWKILPIEEKLYSRETVPGKKPKSYELMITLAETLSKEIPFARIDFYEIDGNPYFGEITFFSGSGWQAFSSREWDEVMGEWLILPKGEV